MPPPARRCVGRGLVWGLAPHSSPPCPVGLLSRASGLHRYARPPPSGRAFYGRLAGGRAPPARLPWPRPLPRAAFPPLRSLRWPGRARRRLPSSLGPRLRRVAAPCGSPLAAPCRSGFGPAGRFALPVRSGLALSGPRCARAAGCGPRRCAGSALAGAPPCAGGRPGGRVASLPWPPVWRRSPPPGAFAAPPTCCTQSSPLCRA